MPDRQPNDAFHTPRHRDLVVGDRVANRQGGGRGDGSAHPGTGSAKREGVWLRATADGHRPAYGLPSGSHRLAAFVTRHRLGVGVVVVSWMLLFGYTVTRLMR